MLMMLGTLCAQRQRYLPDTIGLCRGDSATIEIKHPFGSGAAVKWTGPRSMQSTSRRIKASEPGRYYIRVVSDNQKTITDSTFLRVFERPESRLRDTGLCAGKKLTVDAMNPGMRYQWSNGGSSRTMRIDAPGRYWVRITNGRCAVTDTFHVRRLQEPMQPLPREATLCIGEENRTLTVKTGGNARVLWSTGSTASSVFVPAEGTYWVRAENDECGAVTDTVLVRFKACDCEMIIPNSFTPNEDNRNDYFFPVLQCEYSSFSITITDRWGNVVFSSNSPSARWDGRYKNNLCPEDIYVYHIESTEKATDRKSVRNGHISLFR